MTKPTIHELEVLLQSNDHVVEIRPDGSVIARSPPREVMPWPDPTPEMLNDPTFNAIWGVVKTWDINVPHAYVGYCGATGNHARAILDGIVKARAAAS